MKVAELDRYLSTFKSHMVAQAAYNRVKHLELWTALWIKAAREGK